jgi:Phospholipase_D-nuclease N-terminal
MVKPKWSDLNERQRRLVIVWGAGATILGLATLIDVMRRPADQIRGPKWLWSSAAFIDYVGPIAYFIYGRPQATSP